MANRLKEDEKNERIIRNLLKLQENRRCINCNSLGPQYVCTNFWTFVCTSCSGIHREFTHRVKSVSMAKFTPQEVSALQGGGNASAKEIYLKEWDPQRNSLPDSSNIDRLRDFIKHVYVDRRYTGERYMEKPPRSMKGENDEIVGNRRIDNNLGGSRSPPYEDTMERRYGERPSSGGRSPGYSPDTRRDSDYKKSPARPEVINDWRREDRFGNGKNSEDRNSDGGSTLGSRSPNAQQDMDAPSPPIIRPVREILGDAVSPLRVIEPPKVSGAKSAQGLNTQRTASSSSLASGDASPPPQIKAEASFIDFDSVPEPSIAEPTPQTKQAAPEISSLHQTAPSDNNWANFDSVSEVKSQTTVSNPNSVDSVLSALSVPAPAPSSSAPVSTPQPSQSGGSQGSLLDSSFGNVVPPIVHTSSGAPPPSQGAALQNTNAGLNLFANTHTGGQWPSMEPQQNALFTGGMVQPVSQIVTSTSVGPANNQPWSAPVAPNVAAGPTTPIVEPEPKSSGRKALPEDLFTMSYNYAPQVWYTPYPVGMPTHYSMPKEIAVLNSQQVLRSTNPFDYGDEPSAQPSAFPSVASLQGALPNAMNAQPPYASAAPPSSFVGGQVTALSKMSSGPFHSVLGLDHSAFASLNPNQQLGGEHASNSSFGGGNPFG